MTIRPSRRLLAVGACLAALLLGLATACDADKADAKPPAELAIQAPGRHSSFKALTYGHFEVDDGCLFLVVDSKLRYIPVFPRGITRWDGDALVIGDHRIDLGESVQSGGGEVPSATAIGVKPPTACPATTRAWMVGASTHAR